MMILWTCRSCQHQNWTPGDDIKNLVCEKCGEIETAPMEVYWEIRHNQPDPRHVC